MKTSRSIGRVPVRIRNELLSNTNLKWSHYDNPLGGIIANNELEKDVEETGRGLFKLLTWCSFGR
jgi:hypothetical protein